MSVFPRAKEQRPATLDGVALYRRRLAAETLAAIVVGLLVWGILVAGLNELIVV